MRKEIKKSLIAHLITISFASIIGVICLAKYGPNPKNFLIGFGITGAMAMIVFLAFAIPVERGWISRKSWVWKSLIWYDEWESKNKKMINICELPGMIMMSFANVVFFVVAYIIVITLGNVINIIFHGSYYNFNGDEEEIPLISNVYIGEIRFKPWMILLPILAVWEGVHLIKWLTSLGFIPIWYILGTVAISGFIYLIIKVGIVRSIWNLILAVEKKSALSEKFRMNNNLFLIFSTTAIVI